VLVASAVSAQQPADIDALVARVGQRVADYYRRAERVVCIERATVQPIASDWTSTGFARTVESELRVESEPSDGDTPADPQVIRNIRSVNGKPPRARDTTGRAGCTDPTPFSTEPLAFLLPAHRDEYRFTAVRSGKDRNHAALIIDFTTVSRASRPVLVEDPRGHDDCFDWTGPVAARGRVWVDAVTYDVLRVERRLYGPVDVRVPWKLQRRYNLGPWVEIERNDETLRYTPVPFADPDEVLVLPESTESLMVLRGGLQSTHRTWRFSDYRRFVTSGRIIKKSW
jgi:hypothetical protein